jgi:hypothetical protein
MAASNAPTRFIANAINAILTGFSSGAGTVAATDTILQAINKLVGNIALKGDITSQTFVTPNVGVATATSVNKVTITAPATSATLTLVTGSSLITVGAFAITFTSTATTGVTLPTTGTLATLAGTETFTNKRVTQRIGTTASSSTPTPDADANDIYTVTALAANATFGAPTGTPTNGQGLVIRIKDNATARTLAFNAIYRFGTDIVAPTTTVISKTMYLQFIYNSADTKWDCVGLTNNI